MNKKVLIPVLIVILVSALTNTAYGEQQDTLFTCISPLGSSFKTSIDGQLEFILMEGWSVTSKSQYEYIITRDLEGEPVEIGGIEILSRERSAMPDNKMFTNLKDSGGSFILIEDILLEMGNHSQYHIKWIKEKRYYVDVYIMQSGAASYHITLASDLKYFEKLFQQYEGFVASLGIRDLSLKKGYSCYYNNVDKYAVYVPEGWEVDNSNEFAGTIFCNPDLGKLYIYKQQLEGIKPDTYMYYSNKKILEGAAGVQVLFRKDEKTGNNRVVEYLWERPSIKGVQQDFNYYYEINVIPENEEYVYTYIMKTGKEVMEEAFSDMQYILNSIVDVDYDIKIAQADKEPKDMEVLIEGGKTKLYIPGDKTLWGLFTTHIPGNYMDGIREAEANLGHKFEFIMTYTSFGAGFPEADVRDVYSDGRIMMLTLHPWIEGNLDNIMIPGIVGGEYDDYLREWAYKIKELEKPVLFRFANEMNGDWDPWCAWFFAKDQDLYIKAWRRVHDIFTEEGASNAYFVWNPHDRSFPDFKWNNPHLYYPGDDYVDWIGLTGYNNGTSHSADVWRDFGPIYNDIYKEYSELYPNKPLIITEFASNEVGGNKAAWIRDAFEKIARDYPAIKIAVWFNQVDGLWQYPIYSSPEARAAFLEGLRHERFNFKAVDK